MHIAIRLKKRETLAKTFRIQRRIYPTALHDSLAVQLGLSVANQVDFFAGQFLLIWPQK
jgi:hypothetical protein